VSSLFELVERPDFDAPVMVQILDGWIDAGLGAAGARAALLDQLDTVTVAVFDSDQLLDHRARRPVLHLVDGVTTGLSWPTIELRAASDSAGTDFLMLVGAEPDHAWRAFCDAVVDLEMDLGVRLTVGLGAYPAPVPHTRPPRLAATASETALANRPGLVRATVDVPAGVQAAIERRSAEVGIPAIGLWAQVPHYAAAMPYPAASAALIEGLADTTGLVLDAGDLPAEAEATRARLDELIALREEHQDMVRQLEVEADDTEAAAPLAAGPLPSGDELAAELERFLRDQER
jgi:PAC2 family